MNVIFNETLFLFIKSVLEEVLEKELDNLDNLISLVLKKRDFIINYEPIFSANFEKLSYPLEKRVDREFLRNVGRKLYKVLFIEYPEKNPVDELERLSSEIVETMEDIKPVFTKVFLLMIKDFVDHLVRSDGDGIATLKALISLMDIYMEVVDRVFLDKFKETKGRLKESEKERELIAINLLSSAKLENKKITVLNFYREVPVTCEAVVVEVERKVAHIVLKGCPFVAAFSVGDRVFLKVEHITKPLKASILELDYEKGEMALSGFDFSEIPQERRRFVRVKPFEEISITVVRRGSGLEGKMADISVGGVGVLFGSEPPFSKGDNVRVCFTLDGERLNVEGEIRYVVKSDNFYRAGIEFHASPHEEEVISEYVMKVQFQILKQLRLLGGRG